MSFAFIPSAVRKKQPVLVSSRTPSASISVGAQVTSESTDNSRETKVLTIILFKLNDILIYSFLRIKPAQNQSKIK